MRTIILTVILSLAFTAAPSHADLTCQCVKCVESPSNYPPIPEISRWEESMRTYGQQHCRFLMGGSKAFDPLLAATYYDAAWVYYQIADYTRDNSWLACADAAEKIYRDRYVRPNQGRVPGYWIFPHGLVEDALRTGDSTSREAVHLLAANGSFAPDTPYNNGYLATPEGARENAYVLMAYLADERLGQGLNPRAAKLAQNAFAHIKSWTTGRASAKPFMVGLTAQALIEWHQRTGDQAVLPALTTAADWLWLKAWRAQAQAFVYEVPGDKAAPDLNLLVAPMFAWLWKETKEPRFLERGDQVFAGGVKGAWLGTGKHFAQSYRWSFAFVRWRPGAR